MQFIEKFLRFLWWLIDTSSLLSIISYWVERVERTWTQLASSPWWKWRRNCCSAAQITVLAIDPINSLPSNSLNLPSVHLTSLHLSLLVPRHVHIVRSPNVDNFWFKWLSSFKMFTVCLAGMCKTFAERLVLWIEWPLFIYSCTLAFHSKAFKSKVL